MFVNKELKLHKVLIYSPKKIGHLEADPFIRGKDRIHNGIQCL